MGLYGLKCGDFMRQFWRFYESNDIGVRVQAEEGVWGTLGTSGGGEPGSGARRGSAVVTVAWDTRVLAWSAQLPPGSMRFCRKFSFEVIWGMISPHDSWGPERGRATMAVSFKGAHFPQEVILPCVRWYVAYPLSTRHIEELMLERGVHVDHSTVNRWVIKYSPPLAEAFHRASARCGSAGGWTKRTSRSKVNGITFTVPWIRPARPLTFCSRSSGTSKPPSGF